VFKVTEKAATESRDKAAVHDSLTPKRADFKHLCKQLNQAHGAFHEPYTVIENKERHSVSMVQALAAFCTQQHEAFSLSLGTEGVTGVKEGPQGSRKRKSQAETSREGIDGLSEPKHEGSMGSKRPKVATGKAPKCGPKPAS
jgi:hypothetical protein